MNDAQRAALRNLCEGFKVPFDESHYFTYPADGWMMPGWCEGWLGGSEHSADRDGRGGTIYVGCSPEGGCHS